MEEFVSQHNLPRLTGNLGPIPKESSDQAQHDGAAESSSAQVVAGHPESSFTITPDHIPETVRRKLIRHLRQAPLLTECLSEVSQTDEEPGRRKKRQRALKSGKVRTADSTLMKIISWPHELMYNSGGEPVTYEQISIPNSCLDISQC